MKLPGFSPMLATICISACCAAHAQAVLEIKRDPFAGPHATVSAKSPHAVEVHPPSAPHVVQPSLTSAGATEWRPVPQAIIAGGIRPTVYVEGQMMVVGNVMQGYELKTVREQEAVFVFRGKELTIRLDAQTP